jgi:competence ComEA-like helix-hairpin-helix protein
MPTESCSPQTESDQLAAAAEKQRKLRPLMAAFAALAAYLGLALALKPDLTAHVTDSLAQVRETVSGRFRKLPGHPLDLNQATAAELQQLPGIGPVTAQDIIRFRERSGPIRRPEDLLALPRFTRRLLERIRPYVVVEAR